MAVGKSTTPRRRRGRLLLPKPTGALAKLYDFEAGRLGTGADVTPAERRLLRHIVDEADIVAETPNPDVRAYYLPVVVWLLVPLPPRLLDTLAEFETDEREADTDREPDVDGEPSLAATEEIDQSNLSARSTHGEHLVDLEVDEADEEPNVVTAERMGWAPKVERMTVRQWRAKAVSS